MRPAVAILLGILKNIYKMSEMTVMMVGIWCVKGIIRVANDDYVHEHLRHEKSKYLEHQFDPAEAQYWPYYEAVIGEADKWY